MELVMSGFTRERYCHIAMIGLLVVALAPLSGPAQAEGRLEPAAPRLATLDANGDRQVSLAEVATGPVDQAAGMRLFLARHYKAIDRNRDGMLSEAELEAWRTRYAVSEASLARSLSERPGTRDERREHVLRP
jgi:hypothetical protein